MSTFTPGPPTQTPTFTPTLSPSPAPRFYSLTPCRIVDTRQPDGSVGGPALAAGGTRVFGLGGACGLPPSARAGAFNVTVTGATSGGYLTAYPTGAAAPLASTINFGAGQTRANNAILSLSPAGNLSVYCGIPSGSVDLVIDVTGYFE
jgi:hypothetical protein